MTATSGAPGGLYDHPHYYDVAFSAGTTEQAGRLCQLFDLHRSSVNSILEPACGSGRIVAEFARRGCRISGYDQHPLMVAFVQGRIAQGSLGDRADVRRGDMRSATYPRQYDAAVNLFNSLGHLHDDADVVCHFGTIASALRPGGVYVIQADCAWDDLANAPERRWAATHDGIRAAVSWRVLGEDRDTKVSRQLCILEVADRWGDHVIEESLQLRVWLAEDLQRLAAERGFALKAIYDEDLHPLSMATKLCGELGNLYFVFSAPP